MRKKVPIPVSFCWLVFAKLVGASSKFIAVLILQGQQVHLMAALPLGHNSALLVLFERHSPYGFQDL
jgi:hypothetical protein